MPPKTMTCPILALALASCTGAGPQGLDGGYSDDALEFDGGVCTPEQLPEGVIGPCPSIKRACQSYRAAELWTWRSLQECKDRQWELDGELMAEAWDSCTEGEPYNDGCMDRCDYYYLWNDCIYPKLYEVLDCRRVPPPCHPPLIPCDPDPTWEATVDCDEPDWRTL